jgi:hypothetical protein
MSGGQDLIVHLELHRNIFTIADFQRGPLAEGGDLFECHFLAPCNNEERKPQAGQRRGGRFGWVHVRYGLLLKKEAWPLGEENQAAKERLQWISTKEMANWRHHRESDNPRCGALPAHRRIYPMQKRREPLGR